jgi:Uma2 family endonuclease
VEKYLTGAPAIAIEVISPSNTVKRIDAKAELYFECGGREVSRVFPRTKQVSIQVPGSAPVMPADAVIATPLLPGLALTIREIFRSESLTSSR